MLKKDDVKQGKRFFLCVYLEDASQLGKGKARVQDAQVSILCSCDQANYCWVMHER